MLGITQQELESYFKGHIKMLKERNNELYPDVIQAIKNEYFGYSWDGINYVYNPFVLLSVFKKMQFGDYWYQSGTPTFLMKLIKQDKYTVFDLENKSVFLSTFYLVIKMLGFNIETEIMTIDGRIDAVLQTDSTIYIIEFKTSNTKKAIDQLFEKQYHLKYTTDKRPINLLGIDFDTENKCIADYKLRSLSKQ